MAPGKIALLGATGETGRSILNGLLEQNFSIVALTRTSSLAKPATQALRQKGVEIREIDLEGRHENLVAALKDIDTVVSAVSPPALLSQIPLATAAKEAGVRRFVPCSFMTIGPPDGVMLLRDLKEKINNHIKKIYLPYTIIDVGWWYQISIPRLPSGKIDYIAAHSHANQICGTGDLPSALTDLRDVGKYVAKIIADDRTLNKYVMAYNEMFTPNQVYDKLEEISGEKLPRTHISEKELRDLISSAERALETDPSDARALTEKYVREYQISWGIRGDNTPEYAAFLGYITSKELYPDFQFRDYAAFLKEVLDGKTTAVYAAAR